MSANMAVYQSTVKYFPIIKKWLYSDHDIFVMRDDLQRMRCDHQTEKAGSYGRFIHSRKVTNRL